MSVQLRKKSHSISHTQLNNNQSTQRTIATLTNKKNHVSTSRSVTAFVQNSQITKRQNSNSKYNTNPTSKSISKFSIQNKNFSGGYNDHGHTRSRQKKFQSAKNIMANQQSCNNGGNFYKEAIQKRKRTHLAVSDNKAIINEQLFLMIDTFQQALCSLPLEKLIMGQNPFQWVQQQEKTLQKLKQNFYKVQHTLKQQTKQYYNLKLQNVLVILRNIKQNLHSLQKLKNYTSGGTSIQSHSSLQSRNSHSSSSIFTINSNFTTQNNAENIGTKENKTNQMSNCISQHRTKRSSQMSTNNHKFLKTDESQQNKENIKRYSNFNKKQGKQQKSNMQQKQQANLYFPSHNPTKKNQQQVNQKSNFILQQYKSTKSYNNQNSYVKPRISTKNSNNCFYERKQCLKSFQNNDSKEDIEQNDQTKRYNQLNDNEFSELKVEENLSGQIYRNKNSTIMMNKTVSKYQNAGDKFIGHHHLSKQTQNTMPNQNHLNSTLQYHNEDGQFSSQTYQQNATKHINNSSPNQQKQQQNIKLEHQINSYTRQINSLKQQISLKNKIITQIQQKYEKILKLQRKQFAKKQKQYLETIYELKQSNEVKEKGMRELLMQEQAKSDQIELVKRELVRNGEVSRGYEFKVKQLEKAMQISMKELKSYKIREQQLRQTVHLQRQRTKNLQKQLQLHQTTIQTHLSTLSTKQSKITQLQTQLHTLSKTLQTFQKSSQKQTLKQQIYKQKYYKLMTEYNKIKNRINQNDYYWEKVCLNCKKEYVKEYGRYDGKGEEKCVELRELIGFHKRRLVGADENGNSGV